MSKLTGKNALICGDGRTLELTFPFDITGYTVFFTVKVKDDSSADDSDALIQKTITDFDDAVNGLASIELTGEDTRIDPGKYRYDIQVKASGGEPSSTVPQDIEFVNDVTKRTA